MESTTKNFLSRKEIMTKINKKEKLNPIDRFLLRYGTTYDVADNCFRKELFDLLFYVKNEKK